MINKEKVSKLFEFSQKLKKQSENDFGKCIFAFANFECDCGLGLAIFPAGKTKPIILVYNPEVDYQEVYQKALIELQKNEKEEEKKEKL